MRAPGSPDFVVREFGENFINDFVVFIDQILIGKFCQFIQMGRALWIQAKDNPAVIAIVSSDMTDTAQGRRSLGWRAHGWVDTHDDQWIVSNGADDKAVGIIGCVLIDVLFLSHKRILSRSPAD